MQLGVARPVRPQLDHAQARPAHLRLDGRPQVRVAAAPRSAIPEPERLHDRPELDPVRRPEQLFVVNREAGPGRRRSSLGQQREDPAAVVVHQDDQQVRGVQSGRHESAEIVQERHVADDKHDRALGHRGRAERRRGHAVDPVRTAVAEHADGPLARGQPGVHVPHRHRIAGPKQRPGRKQLAQSLERRALERLLQLAEPRVERPVGGFLGGEPGPRPRAARLRVRPVAGRLRVRDRIRQSLGRRRRVRPHERRGDEPRLAPASAAVDDEQFRTGRLDELRDRLRRGHRPEANDDLRRMGVDPRTRPDDVVGVGEDERAIVRPAAQTGERVGQDRVAGSGGEARDRLMSRRVVERSGDDEAALRRGQVLGDLLRLVGGQRPPALDRGGERRLGERRLVVRDGAEILGRDQRLAQRQVEMDRPSRSFERRGDRSPGHRADMRQGVRRLVHQRELGEPFRMTTVKVVLVDRLRRAAIAQLRRPIGGQNDERHPGERSLDDGRREVDHGRARGRQEDNRAPGRSRDAEGEEPGRALVDQDPDSDSVVRSKCQRERGRSRAGTHDRVANAGPGQLFDEGAELARPAATRAHGSSPARPRAAATARILILDSSHSQSGSESATIPHPA